MPERADTLEVIGLIMFAPLLYSMVSGLMDVKQAEQLSYFSELKNTFFWPGSSRSERSTSIW
jgi:hypothetical protein